MGAHSDNARAQRLLAQVLVEVRIERVGSARGGRGLLITNRVAADAERAPGIDQTCAHPSAANLLRAGQRLQVRPDRHDAAVLDRDLRVLQHNAGLDNEVFGADQQGVG